MADFLNGLRDNASLIIMGLLFLVLLDLEKIARKAEEIRALLSYEFHRRENK